MLLYTHTLEVHTEFATLYLRGALGGADVAVARATCARLPRSIRLLRVDASGIDATDAVARAEISKLVRYWRRERLGHVIIAGLDGQRDDGVPDSRIAWMDGINRHSSSTGNLYAEVVAGDQALMGMYL
jgi:hypothetical protein